LWLMMGKLRDPLRIKMGLSTQYIFMVEVKSIFVS
jgi:hypothetical protein